MNRRSPQRERLQQYVGGGYTLPSPFIDLNCAKALTHLTKLLKAGGPGFRLKQLAEPGPRRVAPRCPLAPARPPATSRVPKRPPEAQTGRPSTPTPRRRRRDGVEGDGHRAARPSPIIARPMPASRHGRVTEARTKADAKRSPWPRVRRFGEMGCAAAGSKSPSLSK